MCESNPMLYCRQEALCLVRLNHGGSVLDLQAFVVGLKSHALDHGFHIEDERHYVETYSGEQVWNIGLHPEDGCDGHIAVEISVTASTRAIIAFEDALREPEGADAGGASSNYTVDQVVLPLTVEVVASPLATAPDLLVLATDLPTQSHAVVPLAPTLSSKVELLDEGEEYCLHVSGEVWVPLISIYQMEDLDEVCAALDSVRTVCAYLADRVAQWME